MVPTIFYLNGPLTCYCPSIVVNFKMFSSVPLSILSAVLPVVLAQSSGSGSDSGSYVAGLVDHLNGLGYTEAASVLTKVNSTTSGQQWLSELPNGNYTAFVPDNAACDYFEF